MTIPCHLLIGWHLARWISPEVKARRWIAWAGVVPDLDGVGLVADAVTRRTNLYEAWHHFAGHNIFAAVLVAGLAGIFCRSAKVAVWAGVCFHLHLAADLISGRGPDGSGWPVVYFWPLNGTEIQWSGQWRLDAWPNTVVYLVLLGWMILAVRREGRSPLEMLSARLDRRVIATFRALRGRNAGTDQS